MRVRHKIPSIFNLSMVDVLCCALGCVILLWLLNLRDASQKADEVGATHEQLTAAFGERDTLAAQVRQARDDLMGLTHLSWSLQTQIDDTTIQLGNALEGLRTAKNQLENTTRQLTATQKDRDDLKKDRDTLEKERDTLRVKAADLTKLLDGLQARLKEAEGQIALGSKNYLGLESKLTTATQRITSLELMLRDKEALALANAQKAESLSARLTAAEDKLKKSQTIASGVPDLEMTIKDYKVRFAKEHALALQLEKDINEKMKEIDQLRQDMTLFRNDRTRMAAAEDRALRLAREMEQMKATAENRFAGINLTGKRVVFLVDMSGSMERIDKDTLAPDKWKGVRETLAKVMQSLPELEKFQVILFAEKLQYLLGSTEGWLDYDPKKTPEAVLDAMAAVRPEGGTNMHMGLEAAFNLKSQGLDTIYLLSDGLPNTGPGLTADLARSMKPTDQAEVLGRYIRTQLKNDWNKAGVERARIRIHCLGFFYESPDLGAFLWALARENDGNFVGMSQP